MDEESTAVNQEVVQDTTATESAPVENKTSEDDQILDILSDESEEKPRVTTLEPEEVTEEPTEPEPEEAEVTEPEAEIEKPSKADERKQQLNTEIRSLVEERNRIQQELEQFRSSSREQQTIESLQAEGYSDVEIENFLLKQKVEEISAQTERQQQSLQATYELTQDANRVLSELSIFNDRLPNGQPNPEYVPELAAQAAEMLDKSLIRDENGNILGATLTPYQIYKPISDAYERSRMQGQIKGQQAAEKMLSSVDAPTSAAPKQPKKDPILEMLSSDDF